jgi:hypothetical protein
MALVFLACKKDKAEPVPASPEAARPSAAPLQGEQASLGGLEAEAAPGPYPLTKEKLEAYVGSQRKLLEAYYMNLKDLAKGKRDGGRGCSA